MRHSISRLKFDPIVRLNGPGPAVYLLKAEAKLDLIESGNNARELIMPLIIRNDLVRLGVIGHTVI
ncbi:hypothetical protein D3C73_1260910 [compost metagenome]